MNETLKAIVEVSGGSVRSHHINLRGAFGVFPDDCFGASNEAAAAKTVTLAIGHESVDTDIDEGKAIFANVALCAASSRLKMLPKVI